MDGNQNFSLRQFFGVLRRRKWVLVQVALIVAAGAVALSLRTTNTYEATAAVLVGPAKSAPLAGLTEAEQTLSPGTAAKLLRTREVAERVRESLNTSLTVDQLLARVSTSADPRDGFVYVTARGDNGTEAAQLANAFANQFVDARAENAKARLSRAVNSVEAQLRQMPAQSEEREALGAQLAQLRIAALPIADADIADPAMPSSDPVAPNPVRDGVLGLGLGLLLGLGLAFALEAFDPRIRSSSELQELVSAPQLAGVPASVFDRGFGRSRREPRVTRAARMYPEAFERMRTALLVFNAERDLGTIVVTSPHSEKEGKTTVAANLALSLAKVGLKVAVVDADLRKPRIARHFGFDDGAGLTDVLEHGVALKQAVLKFPVLGAPTFNGNGNGNGNGKAAHKPAEITVLGAGGATEAPAELLASKGMQDVLDQLERDHDVVIVDCPPILAESDAMPLLPRAAGTLLVVRLFHTPRQSASRAARVVEGARGGLLGVVGTGVPAKELREEGYGPWPVTHAAGSHVA